MHVLFADIRPYKTGFLSTDDGHEIYYEQSGSPDGIPVLFIHGGPGAGTDPAQRRFFDPEHYRIVLFDQRGCGRSTPHASVENNTTQHLIQDMEQLRETLGIKKWMLFGGSWGSTLSLAYAQAHPDSVSAMIIRGIFLGTKPELDWLYQSGASKVFPDYYQKFAGLIPEAERGDLLAAYHKRMHGDDEIARMNAAKHWAIWEGSIATLHYNADLVEHFEEPHNALGFGAIATHYLSNGCFLEKPLLEGCDKIAHIPTVLVHGRYDMVCALDAAWQLHQALPESQLRIVRDAGHSAMEPGTIDVLVRSTNEFIKVLKPNVG